jgi:hypothetical protein
MTFIDWSDPEALFDMLIEYTADEKKAAHGDSRRVRWLDQMLAQLSAAQTLLAASDLPGVMTRLKHMIGSIPPEFREDPVVDHFTACLEELERIKNQTS